MFWFELGLFAILLFLSAFFSGSETALFSLQDKTLKKLKEETSSPQRAIFQLLQKPRRLLVTILTGNTVVNIALASLSALIATDLAREYQVNKLFTLLVEVMLVTVIILFFGEITPKVIAVRNALEFSKKVILPP
jgi:Mg2+/Co2+ transporter CorB